MFKLKNYFQDNVQNVTELLKYVGPGFIITVGFIDPGNWATNLSAGSDYGYDLLWVVTLSTIILILLQYNASKLGIVSGKCLAEASREYFSKPFSNLVIYSGLLAVISTIMAELLGGAIALNMIFSIPLKLGAVIMSIGAIFFVFSSTYSKIEGIIIGFVSIIALSFLIELLLAPIDTRAIVYNSFIPHLTHSQLFITMGVIGAVVMPHNLFLHSEFIQSRKLNNGGEIAIKKHLAYSKSDTLFSMTVGWAINCSMIILAAATFYVAGKSVNDLSQAQSLLTPLLGQTASGIFALALLFSGLASSITAAMSAGVLSAGLYKEEYNTHDRHTTLGILTSVVIATIIIFTVKDPFTALIASQVVLSIQLPITIIALICLTNNESLMGKFKNSKTEKTYLYISAALIISINLMFFIKTFI